MDNLKDHYYKSIFNNNRLNKHFWDYNTSNKAPIYIEHSKYKVDAWHLFKSLMIIFICLSIITFKPTFAFEKYLIFTFILYGIIWNVIFNLFYNHILNKKSGA